MSTEDMFEELKRNRILMVNGLKVNNALEGLKQLLTELYPDTAHFIYELLQNAEDKEASSVLFDLRYDKLIFSHNGKKRDFELRDIDAITNIGQGTKKDDPTAIGKFGVGFKAVYSYTNTPEIHSGAYDFKIIDMLVPENIGVNKTATKGNTQFIFPFDNKNKPASIAVNEIEKGLQSLDENALLFLNNIKKIKYVLPNKTEGFVELIPDSGDGKLVTINVRKGYIYHTSVWYKFTKSCDIILNGITSKYPVSIAYKMDKSEGGKLHFVSNMEGNVCIYFKAEKEKSNLRFHIHAPFASTVARDSIRDCYENQKLLKTLGELVVESINYFKCINMLNSELYAVLPNKRDFGINAASTYAFSKSKIEIEPNDNQYYKYICVAVINEFMNKQLFITDDGQFESRYKVSMVSRELAKIFKSSDARSIFGCSWMPAIQPQSHEYYFLSDYGIKNFDDRTILESLKMNKDFLDKFFHLRGAYYALDFIDYLSEMRYVNSYLEYLRKVKMIPCEDGLFHSSADNIFIKTYYTPKHIKNPVYIKIDGVGIASVKINKIKTFLRTLGVRVIDDTLDLQFALKGNQINSEQAVSTLYQVIKEMNQGKSIMKYADIPFILARDLSDATHAVKLVKVSECCITKEVAFFYSGETGYVFAKELYPDELNETPDNIVRVFVALNGKIAPQINETRLSEMHPLYNKLDTYNERDTATKVDYIFSGYKDIKRILLYDLKAEALLLWKMVLQCDKSYVCRAVYRKNKKEKEQYIESSLVWYLKNSEWIRSRQGGYYKPGEITFDELPDEWQKVGSGSTLLNSIGFGQKNNVTNEAVALLRKNGINISAEILKKICQLGPEKISQAIDLVEREALSANTGLSPGEALKEQNKIQKETEDSPDSYAVKKGVKDPAKRAAKLAAQFNEGLENNNIQMHKKLTYVCAESSNEEKKTIGYEYRGVCQICKRLPIKKANGKPHFMAINIIDTRDLDFEYQKNLDIGWNTLCLCPNCAAEYLYSAKNLDGIARMIEGYQVVANDDSLIEVDIMLQGEKKTISFTPKHFLAMQTAFKVYKD